MIHAAETPHQSLSPIGINVRQAKLAWHDRVLFDGLNIDLEAGRWTCLLGPSGIGKSMLLRLILGFERPNDAVTCSDGLPLKGRVAFMAQRDNLFPWLSVLDNVLIGLTVRGENPGERNIRDKAMELLAATGLEKVANALPDTLSGGMRQRAALARTLMENRPIVLMDEPFSALDAITRLRLQELAANLLKDRTVLLVTHDPLEALRLGHSVHVMKGSPAHLSAALSPKGLPPRQVDDPDLLEHQGELLKQLAEAAV